MTDDGNNVTLFAVAPKVTLFAVAPSTSAAGVKPPISTSNFPIPLYLPIPDIDVGNIGPGSGGKFRSRPFPSQNVHVMCRGPLRTMTVHSLPQQGTFLSGTNVSAFNPPAACLSGHHRNGTSAP